MRIEGNDQRLAAATATQLQQSGVQQTLASKTAQKQQQISSDAGKGDVVQSIAGDKVSIKIELSRNTVDTLQKLGNISDFVNSMAINIRQTNAGLNTASGVVAEMKTSLDKIIKSYPPYSIESQERIAQLMQYAGLKNEILSMTVPAPPPPIYESFKHLWTDLFSGANSTLQTPTLPPDAPDSHVNAAAKQLDVISGQISLVQEALSKSVLVP